MIIIFHITVLYFWPVNISMAKTRANVKVKKKKIMNFTSPGPKRTVIMKFEKTKQR